MLLVEGQTAPHWQPAQRPLDLATALLDSLGQPVVHIRTACVDLERKGRKVGAEFFIELPQDPFGPLSPLGWAYRIQGPLIRHQLLLRANELMLG